MQDQAGLHGFDDDQRAGWASHRADQDRTLDAMHALEAALADPAPGREEEWRETVLAALSVLDDVTRTESTNAERPDSLLADIALRQPRLRSRVRGVRLQYRSLRESIASLRQELGEYPEAALDYGDLRQRLGWTLSALRHQRARESDLLYEAYYDAFRVDLAPGGEADPPTP